MTDREEHLIPPGWDFSRPWYHGSPHRPDTLLAGSTITQSEHLARVFSHKPAIVSLDEAGEGLRIRHTGRQPGFLYRVDEQLGPRDVYPHPRTSMAPGLEWLTRRTLRLIWLGPVEIVPAELLSDAEVLALLAQQHGVSGGADAGLENSHL